MLTRSATVAERTAGRPRASPASRAARKHPHDKEQCTGGTCRTEFLEGERADIETLAEIAKEVWSLFLIFSCR